MAARVELRPFARSDFATLLAWVGSADDLVQWAGHTFDWPLDERQLEEHLDAAGPRRRPLTAIEPAGGERVGHVMLSVLSEGGTGHIGGVIVAPSARGQGYGGAVLREVARLGFDELRLHRLQLWVYEGNTPAIACYERAGFVREGLARETIRVSTGWRSSILMGLLAADRRPD